MIKIITIIQMVIAAVLVVSILLQNRGAGLSAAFGGDMGGYYTKRGMEKFLNYFSIGLSVVFLALAIVIVWLTNRS